MDGEPLAVYEIFNNEYRVARIRIPRFSPNRTV